MMTPSSSEYESAQRDIIRYLIAIGILAAMTLASFQMVRDLIVEIRGTEVIVMEAAELSFDLHKTKMAARDLILHLKDMAAKGMAHMAHSGPNNRADRMIDYLRTRIATELVRTASIHDALGIATLIVLPIEAVINFRPMVNRLRLKEQRADHAEDELAYLAHHDALTGLLNGVAFERRLANMLESAETE